MFFIIINKFILFINLIINIPFYFNFLYNVIIYKMNNINNNGEFYNILVAN